MCPLQAIPSMCNCEQGSPPWFPPSCCNSSVEYSMSLSYCELQHWNLANQTLLEDTEPGFQAAWTGYESVCTRSIAGWMCSKTALLGCDGAWPISETSRSYRSTRSSSHAYHVSGSKSNVSKLHLIPSFLNAGWFIYSAASCIWNWATVK